MKHYHIEKVSDTELLVHSTGIEMLGSVLGDIQDELDSLDFRGRVVLFQVGYEGFGNDVCTLSYDGSFSPVGAPFQTEQTVSEYLSKLKAVV